MNNLLIQFLRFPAYIGILKVIIYESVVSAREISAGLFGIRGRREARLQAVAGAPTASFQTAMDAPR